MEVRVRVFFLRFELRTFNTQKIKYLFIEQIPMDPGCLHLATIYRRSKKSIPKIDNYFALEPRNTSADDDSILHRGLLTEEEEETAPSGDNVLRSNVTRYKDDDENLNRNVEVFDANDNDNQSATSFVDTPVTFPEEQQQRQNIFSIMDEEEDEENA
ncbi:14651_t:CDS:2 [Dentiscutata heterogama]|uniref:14651_t:CDS:1 n=1 Tax=Dentiscutata heterogama TaxID=1316150 RepID=A0ACA9KNZ7_9GLOM|nr:14651_t:CDS:2 [Dentiscutata heterogama]